MHTARYLNLLHMLVSSIQFMYEDLCICIFTYESIRINVTLQQIEHTRFVLPGLAYITEH